MENLPPEDSKPGIGSEVIINSPEELVEFYEYVLGWRGLEHNQATGEWLVYDQSFDGRGDLAEGHLVFRSKERADNSYIGTFTVSDIDEVTRRAVERGGRKAFQEGEEAYEDTDIRAMDGYSRMRILCDFRNNMFGLVEYPRRHR